VICLAFICLKPQLVHAQRGRGAGTYVETNFGTSNAVRPYTTGYRSATIGLFHAGFGFRRMLNDRFGYRIYLGYDKIKSAKDNSLPFESNYLRMSLQGVVDAGALLNFREFTKRFTMLVYGGFGGSHLFNQAGQSGSMLNFTAGVMPQYRITDRFRLHLDFCRTRHVYQQVKFDLNSSHNELGYDGLIVNASLGFTIYLGN
jgi:OmpA-OmpF porin, OOP family